MKITKENHELNSAQEDFRRGRTSYHAKRALTAKAILQALRKKPGMTKDEILAAIGCDSGHGGFDILQRHKLAYHAGVPARWFATETNPQ